MNFNFIPERFKPTKKKIIWSLIIAVVVDIIYWLVISSTSLYDIIEPIIDNVFMPIMEWYNENITEMLFTMSGLIIILIIFVAIYIIFSLFQKNKNNKSTKANM